MHRNMRVYLPELWRVNFSTDSCWCSLFGGRGPPGCWSRLLLVSYYVSLKVHVPVKHRLIIEVFQRIYKESFRSLWIFKMRRKQAFHPSMDHRSHRYGPWFIVSAMEIVRGSLTVRCLCVRLKFIHSWLLVRSTVTTEMHVNQGLRVTGSDPVSPGLLRTTRIYRQIGDIWSSESCRSVGSGVLIQWLQLIWNVIPNHVRLAVT